MFQLIEVVGTSENGFSEATKNAIQHLAKAGEKIHFFTVIEQRGAVRDNLIQEFQVLLKVAVDYKYESKDSQITLSFESNTASLPNEGEECVCEWCGCILQSTTANNADEAREITYICNNCGRIAVKASSDGSAKATLK